MARGDHVFLWRQAGGIPFQHHAIDVGDGSVVHFANKAGGIAGPGGNYADFQILRAPLTDVTGGQSGGVHVVSHRHPLPPDQVVSRAISQIGRGGYHLIFDNCEHFATWCVVDRDESRQVDVIAERFGAAGVKALAAGTLQAIARRSAKRVLRGAAPLMLAADVAQWVTEAGGHHFGLTDPISRKRAGRAVGLTTAMGVGALAGPAGVAVAGGVWVAGEVAGEVSRKSMPRKLGRYIRNDR